MRQIRLQIRSALCALAAVTAAGVAQAADNSPTIVLDGAPEVIFQWSRDACARDDIPDVPARAFRAADGTVRLIASHYVNRAMTGPDLNHLRPDCRVIYQGRKNDSPASFDDRAWLAAPYTFDGQTIYALVHNEFHGHVRPDLCPSRSYNACWANAITWAQSRDGGATFAHPPAPANLVAALPYKYRGDSGTKSGYFAPSNIVARDGYFYSLVFAVSHEAQAHGVCLIRTDRLDDPRSWRAWDGRGFNVRFVDPYREEVADPRAHVCAPVGRGRLASPVGSITRHEPSGLYVAILVTFRPPRVDAEPVGGVFMSTSADLIAWSAPTLVWQTPILYRFACGEKAIYDFPALLDPESLSRNFETTGHRAFLYMTRFNLTECKVPMDRDLIRVPVKITAPR